MFVEYTIAMEVAKAVAKELAYTPRPWNRFEPTTTEWWVVPSKEIHCYKYGKYFFKKRKNVLQCGLYVEKGIESVGKGIIPPNFLMDNTWEWQHFQNDWEIGKIDDTLSNLEGNRYGNINVYIGSSYGGEPAFEPLTGRTDSIDFKWQKGILIKERYMERFGMLAELQSITSMRELIKKLKELKDLGWLWIDIVITVELGIEGNDKLNSAQPIFEASMIIDKVLMPFSEWVR